MSQRNSGYDRKANDAYYTPPWVTKAVASYLRGRHVWEPACGNGAILKQLQRMGFKGFGTDLARGEDFLSHRFLMKPPKKRFNVICTNPPYGDFAQPFIERALYLTKGQRGEVAMLLKTDFDQGVTRRHIFAEHPAWSKKIVLNYRIKWFKSVTGSGPSENHAWFIWDWTNDGKPTIEYPLIDPDEVDYIDVGNDKSATIRKTQELFS